ncbi:MAG TPA: ion transporter [Candidatus Rifleibacterium sp.]|nr:ion transporter [Candidatus Rifleibacterium sp.]HPT44548.1 ion transporter [Candidatus Rifleibacterium sp.]
MQEKVSEKDNIELNARQRWLHTLIYEADTTAGKLFDVFLIFCILASVSVVMLESIKTIRDAHSGLLSLLDWLFTILFTVEYLLRMYAVSRPASYVLSFYGVVDLLAILPNYLGLIFPGAQYLSVVRIIRVMRVFRFLKLAQYLVEAEELMTALKASRRRITVFILAVLTLVIFIGAAMYVIEGEQNGFTSIPVSIYWAVVTLTTVGYGDISPRTPLGQAFAVFIMILGYGIIAIPTGIVTAELTAGKKAQLSTQVCTYCCAEGHDSDAEYCKLCGHKLN